MEQLPTEKEYKIDHLLSLSLIIQVYCLFIQAMKSRALAQFSFCFVLSITEWFASYDTS